jgi:hypothetical protein
VATYRDPITQEWFLRDQIVSATQHWPIIALFCLIGSMIGWGISYVWPTPQRATVELYVGLDISQALTDRNASEYAGIQFDNPDDYKNWQMANLNSLIYMDEIIDGTLAQLQQTDPYWSTYSRRQLREMLHVYWRNAGKWRLVAEGVDQLRTAQAVTVWQNVVVETVHQAVEAARQTYTLDQQLQALAATHAQAIARNAELTQLSDTLQIRREFLLQKPLDLPLGESDRWSIWQPLAQTDLGAAWAPLGETFPNLDSPLREYIPWLERATASLDYEIQASQAQITALENEENAVNAAYAQASKTSLGLSPNLEVEMITTEPPQLNKVRPTSLLVLIGGLLGLIVWGTSWLVSTNLRVSR